MRSVLGVVAVLLPTGGVAQSRVSLEAIERYVGPPGLQARMHQPGGRASDMRTLLETVVGSALDETRKRRLPLVRGKKRAQRMVLSRAAREVCIKGGGRLSSRDQLPPRLAFNLTGAEGNGSDCRECTSLKSG